MSRKKQPRNQGGNTPTTEPQSNPEVVQFSVSEVAQFSMALDTDGGASFTKVIAADGITENDEGLEVKFFSDAARGQQVGATLSVTLKEPSVGMVTDGPDIITGTTANETITGIPAGSSLRGKGTVDKLTGGGGNDVFLLGSPTAAYYDDQVGAVDNTTDLGWITDFSAGDKIVLHGSAANYKLSSGRYLGLRGVYISALVSPEQSETIGFVQSATLAQLNLANNDQFTYVMGSP